MMILRITAKTQAIQCGDASCFGFFFKYETSTYLLRGEISTFSIMQLTIAGVNTTRMYHSEANEKDNSPNSEHFGFDTLHMAAIRRV